LPFIKKKEFAREKLEKNEKGKKHLKASLFSRFFAGKFLKVKLTAGRII